METLPVNGQNKNKRNDGKPNRSKKNLAKRIENPSSIPLSEGADSYRKLLFVLNPVAGRMNVKKELAEILRIFTLNGYLPTVYVTASKGDSEAFIRRNGKDFDLVVCSGGDGSLNEAISGWLRGSLTQPLGYIPGGSTNVFADCHSFSLKPVRAAEDLVLGKEFLLDVGCFNRQYFGYVAAFGAFTGLSYTTPQNMKNVLGPGAYVVDAVRDLGKIRREHVIITGTGYFPVRRNGSFVLSEKRTGILADGDFIFGCVNNSTSIASRFYLPDDMVSYDDGAFEVCLVRYPDIQLDLQNTLTYLSEGEYFEHPEIVFFRASDIHISSAPDLPWTLDGELAEDMGEIDVHVVPRCLRFLLPR